MFSEVPQVSLGTIFRTFVLPQRSDLHFRMPEGYFVIPTSSGKSAMHLVLEWLRHTGVLTSRMDEILVPQWMGAWVYKTMHSHGFPQILPTMRTKVIWVYHQYGFAQDMDAILDFAHRHNCIVIEDCAHALESNYKGLRLGTIGDFGIFSFSKFLPSLMGGAIITKNQEARDYFLNRIGASRTLYAPFLFWSKYFDEYTHHAPFAQELLKTSYSLYAYQTAMTRTVQNLIARSLASLQSRKENYTVVKRVLKGDEWTDSLDAHALPYVVPLRGSEEELSRIVAVIRDAQIYSGIYHFDKNQNVLKPQWVKVAWLPIHQDIPAKIIGAVSAKIKNILKKST